MVLQWLKIFLSLSSSKMEGLPRKILGRATLRRLLHKRRKVRVFVWKGIRKNIISYYSSTFTINPQPRCRSVHSHSVLFSEEQDIVCFKRILEYIFLFFHLWHNIISSCGSLSSTNIWEVKRELSNQCLETCATFICMMKSVTSPSLFVAWNKKNQK